MVHPLSLHPDLVLSSSASYLISTLPLGVVASLLSALCSRATEASSSEKCPAGVAQHQFTGDNPFLAWAHLTWEEAEGEVMVLRRAYR